MAVLVLMAVVPAGALAAAGDLDPTFDDDGRVTLVDPAGFVARALTLQADGRIIVAGGSCETGSDATCSGGGNGSFRLARFTTGGGLDASFGQRGVVTTPINHARSQAYDVLVAGDGTIWAGGVGHDASPQVDRDGAAVVRYDANGAVIGEPLVKTPGSGFSAIAGLAQGPNGTVYATGQVNGHMLIARFTAAGELDPDFGGGNGWVDAGPSSGYGYGLGITAAPDGGAVAAGIVGDSQEATASYRFGIVRVDPTGTAVSEPERIPVGSSSSYATAVSPTADGGWIAAGTATTDTSGAMAVLRGGSTGVTPAWTRLVPAAAAAASDVALAPDGRIVVAGQVAWTTGLTFGVARLLADGTPDASFGLGGFTAIDWGRYARATAVAVQGDGRIVTAGIGCNGGTADLNCTDGQSVLLLARQQAVTTATPGPPPAPTPGPGVTPPPAPAPSDTTKPKGRLTGVPERIGRSALRRKGFKLRIRATEPVGLDLRLSGPRRGTRRKVTTLVHVVLRNRRRDVAVRVRPSRKALSRAKAGRLTLTVRIQDAAGNAATIRDHLRLR
jgi:uncharacterized delta-60 repeat protein